MGPVTLMRQERRLNNEYRKLHGWTKPLLVEALRNVQSICPPRVSRQDKADLERIVNRALNRSDNDPLRLAMQRALADARRAI
jgi:hypothetical protein